MIGILVAVGMIAALFCGGMAGIASEMQDNEPNHVVKKKLGGMVAFFGFGGICLCIFIPLLAQALR